MAGSRASPNGPNARFFASRVGRILPTARENVRCSPRRTRPQGGMACIRKPPRPKHKPRRRERAAKSPAIGSQGLRARVRASQSQGAGIGARGAASQGRRLVAEGWLARTGGPGMAACDPGSAAFDRYKTVGGPSSAPCDRAVAARLPHDLGRACLGTSRTPLTPKDTWRSTVRAPRADVRAHRSLPWGRSGVSRDLRRPPKIRYRGLCRSHRKQAVAAATGDGWPGTGSG